MIKLVKLNKYFPKKQMIIVGIGDFKVASNPKILATYALGSCVAIILYNNFLRKGALIHAMLPAPRSSSPDNPLKYVVTSVPLALSKLSEIGVSKRNLVAALIGGANILRHSTMMNIGERNVKMAKEVLRKENIPIVAEDVGGFSSRSVFFDLEEAVIYVTSPKKMHLFS